MQELEGLLSHLLPLLDSLGLKSHHEPQGADISKMRRLVKPFDFEMLWIQRKAAKKEKGLHEVKSISHCFS